MLGNRQILAFKKGQKGDPGSNRPVSLTLVPGKSWSESCWSTGRGTWRRR